MEMPFSTRNESSEELKRSEDEPIESSGHPFLQNQPLFVEDPIVAHISKLKNQRFLFEEIFRSQMKLISDTIAKELIFILEFFDIQMTNKTQQTYMFNSIFRQIISRYYVDRLKRMVDANLFDVYSCLIMIQINEECKKQMKNVYRIGVFDSVLEKISIYILWPRFS